MDDQEAEAHRYHRRQLGLSIASGLLTAAVLVAWLWSGAAASLAASLGDRLRSPAAVVAVMLAAVGGSSAIVTFPLDVLAGFVLPRRAGLLHESAASWLGDRAKGLALGGGLGLIAIEALYALLARSPQWWWLWGAAALGAGTLLLTAALPVWIVPLFYRLTPLADPGLRERLLALATRAGVIAAEVTVADLSRKGRTANAAVVGLGRTRRIVVSDTLLAAFAPDEVEVVLAHELAHHARGHLARAIALQVGLYVVMLGLAHLALRRLVAPLGLAGATDPAGLPLLVLLLAGLGLAVTPIAAAWSRRLEREADADALTLTRAPAAFVTAMERLGRLNLAERRPGRLKRLLFASHPSIEERVAAAQAFARQLPGTA